ncbi:CARDB domain-containing protein [Trichlorobacter lovleyi]|uniref:CARDB domain-containing protein n=1 Tax=Trichlorobacter lovleyi TaxID=313985 RepID=UPI002480B164|nr:CARDB domain-containing protein [Trichlorobacter lovleyi]
MSTTAGYTTESDLVMSGTTLTVTGDLSLPANLALTNSTLIVLGTLSVPGTITMSGSTLTAKHSVTASGAISLTNASVLTHPVSTTTEIITLAVSAPSISIDATSKIDATGKGFLGGYSGDNAHTSGRTTGNTVAPGTDSGNGSMAYSGGSYGGSGGVYDSRFITNVAYGVPANPTEPGAGGGAAGVSSPGGNGGGYVRITTPSLALNGSIIADGQTYPVSGNGGGGAGGGIRIDATAITGAGFVYARGGTSWSGRDGSGGGGGRIAIYYGSNSLPTANILASGGTGRAGASNSNGGAGTVYLSMNTMPLILTKSGLGTGTITSLPAGIACGATCSSQFATNSTVTLTATPDTGSIFTGWSGACSGLDTCSVTMDAAKTVTATFDQLAVPTVSVSSPSDVIRNTRPTLQYTASAGTVTVKVDGITVNKVSGDALDQLSNGPHIVRVEATSYGRTGFAESTFTIDTEAPVLTVTPVTTPVTQPSAVLTGTVEAGLNVTVAPLSGASTGSVVYPAANSWSCPVADLVTGPNTFTITATDLAGNTSTVSVVVTYLRGPVVTVTPASIQADQTVPIQLAVSNSTPQGGALLVEQFVDANKNGLVDAGDYVIRSFNITDGVASSDAGLPGDEDGVVNGATSTSLTSYLTGDLYHAPASYLIRVTQGSLSSVAPFAVAAAPQAQAVSGMVTDGVNPLPGALVRLSDSVGRHIAFSVADETGRYTLQVAHPGTYLVTPLVYGYASSAPRSVSLASGQVLVDQNLAVVPGNFHLTGTVKDETGTTGIQGVWVWAKGQNTSAVVLTAADGSYDLSLPAGQYSLSVSIDPSEPTAFAKGYLINTVQAPVVNLVADSTNNDFFLPRGAYVVSGRVLDQFGNGLAGIPLQGELAIVAGSSEIVAKRVSGIDGAYLLPLISGEQWRIALDPTYAGLNNLIGSSIRNYSTNGSNSTGMNIVTHPVTAWVQGVVKDSANTLLGGVTVVLRNADSSIIASTVTAADGSYRIGAYGGSWYVKAQTEEKGLHPVAEQTAVLTDSQTTTLDFVVDVTPPVFAINPVTTPTTASSQTISGTIEAGATVLVSVSTSALAGTVTYPTSTTWSCTITGLVEGANTVTATATDTSGNQTLATATISYAKPAGPDLIVRAVSLPATLNSGETVQVQVTVKNQGTLKAGKFYIGLYLSSDSTITTGDTFLSNEYLSSLAAGAEVSYTTSITLPANSSGTYYIGAIVDSKGAVTESDETNNSFAVGPVSIGYGPDLVVAALGVPTSLVSGQTVSVPVAIRNQGTGAAGKFYIGLYLSTDSTITTSDTFLGEEYLSSLAAGAQRAYTTNITLPANISGAYYIGAVVDSRGAIAESDETNNSFEVGPISIGYGPDLIVAALDVPASATAGQTISVPVTIQNQGTGAAGTFYIGLYLSTDSTITASDTFLGEEYLSSLAAGTQRSYTASVVLPASASGTYYIGAIVDTRSAVSESEEANNSFVANPTVITK